MQLPAHLATLLRPPPTILRCGILAFCVKVSTPALHEPGGCQPLPTHPPTPTHTGFCGGHRHDTDELQLDQDRQCRSGLGACLQAAGTCGAPCQAQHDSPINIFLRSAVCVVVNSVPPWGVPGRALTRTRRPLLWCRCTAPQAAPGAQSTRSSSGSPPTRVSVVYIIAGGLAQGSLIWPGLGACPNLWLTPQNAPPACPAVGHARSCGSYP